MKRKIVVFLLLCVVTLLHEVATAQGLSIFAKQKVVIWDIIDRNDRPLGESFKRLIYQKIMDNCTNSQRYAVYNECVEDAKQQLKAKGLAPNFPNSCKMIGQKADFIIFTEVEASQSAIGSQDVTIHISMSLYRIQTASKVLSAHEDAAADRQAVESALSRAMAKLGVSSTTTQRQSSQPTYYQPTQPAYQQSAQLYHYRKAAEQGDRASQYYLGICYYNGRGVKEDNYEAVKWFRRAAEQGHANAQYYMGLCYKNGLGVVKDEFEAIMWFRKAANQGHRDAMSELK